MPLRFLAVFSLVVGLVVGCATAPSEVTSETQSDAIESSSASPAQPPEKDEGKPENSDSESPGATDAGNLGLPKSDPPVRSRNSSAAGEMADGPDRAKRSPPSPATQALTNEAFDRIKQGMTLAEVEAILGKGREDAFIEADLGKGTVKTITYLYGPESRAIAVKVESEPNGDVLKVIAKKRLEP